MNEEQAGAGAAKRVDRPCLIVKGVTCWNRRISCTTASRSIEEGTRSAVDKVISTRRSSREASKLRSRRLTRRSGRMDLCGRRRSLRRMGQELAEFVVELALQVGSFREDLESPQLGRSEDGQRQRVHQSRMQDRGSKRPDRLTRSSPPPPRALLVVRQRKMRGVRSIAFGSERTSRTH